VFFLTNELQGIWLLFGAVLSVLTRNIAEEYSESKSNAYAVSLKEMSIQDLIFSLLASIVIVRLYLCLYLTKLQDIQ
jgi:hypothetical protein